MMRVSVVGFTARRHGTGRRTGDGLGGYHGTQPDISQADQDICCGCLGRVVCGSLRRRTHTATSLAGSLPVSTRERSPLDKDAST